MNPGERSHIIKEEARNLGFETCGIAAAVRLEEDARRLENWLSKGYQAGMDYMEKHFELRIDPRLLVPGAQSVITLLYNYYPGQVQEPGLPKIAKYAYGTDYHYVIREKLNHFLDNLRAQFGQIEGRGFVDSAPVLERSWANRSGLGWIGKNGNLISKQLGSFFFIATLITDLELQPDLAFATDHCGSCTRCIDACPTEAIAAPTVIDAGKCISYLTIELKDSLIDNDFKDKMEGWMFGCDICQDVCPWNRFSRPHNEPHFTPIHEVLELSAQEWATLSEESFRRIFRNSPIKRSKFKGIMRNLHFIKDDQDTKS